MNDEKNSPADKIVGSTDGLGAEVWVCPWDICAHEQAQACRAEMGTTKLKRGCGTYFPPSTTLRQARKMIERETPNAESSGALKR